MCTFEGVTSEACDTWPWKTSYETSPCPNHYLELDHNYSWSYTNLSELKMSPKHYLIVHYILKKSTFSERFELFNGLNHLNLM